MEMTEKMQSVIGKVILDTKMPENDAVASTVRDYLQRLLRGVWIDGEGFDGKRPFGNSDWQNEIYRVLVKEGFIKGHPEGDPYDYNEAEELVLIAIDAM